ncbi:MAG: tRNA glutamyl-Q(34) synthetase GluQRS [Alphaproteobacteria bacterium]
MGHVYSAWVGWREAQQSGGRFLLRIDDIDTSRARPEYVEAIQQDLAWLGLDWDGDIYTQTRHQAAYDAALAALDDLGVLYPCTCTRKQIMAELEAAGGAPHGPDGPLYPGTCKHKSADEQAALIQAGTPHALRLDCSKAIELAGALTWHDRSAGNQPAQPETLGDVVLARKDARNSYHLSVVIDDAAQDISLVTRGKDLFHATHMHRLLQALLNVTPPDYLHHELVVDDSGKRLAKRDDARAIAHYRDAGLSPAEVRALAGIPEDL